jgi:hypothetical protein
VDAGFDRPAHEAATIGEVARIMLRITDGPGSTSRLTQEQAVLRLAGRGLMPAGARPYQGLTGAQLLTVLGGVRTAMGDRARPHVQLSADARPPAPAPPAAAQPPAPQGASPTAEPGASAMASAEGGSPARAEPLPPGATDASIERAPQPPSPSAPQGGQANVAEVRHAEPLPPPPPRPAKPRVWVPGKPLRKPGN